MSSPPALVLAPPSEAVPFHARGVYGTHANLALADLQQRLREDYDGRWQVDWFEVPTATTWPQLLAHFQPQLAGWQRDASIPERVADYQLGVWATQGRAAAIAFLDDPAAGEPPQFKILILAVPK